MCPCVDHRLDSYIYIYVEGVEMSKEWWKKNYTRCCNMLLMRKKSGTLHSMQNKHFLPLKVQNDFKMWNLAETSFETIDHFLICDIYFWVREWEMKSSVVVACKAKSYNVINYAKDVYTKTRDEWIVRYNGLKV